MLQVFGLPIHGDVHIFAAPLPNKAYLNVSKTDDSLRTSAWGSLPKIGHSVSSMICEGNKLAHRSDRAALKADERIKILRPSAST